MQGKYTLQDFKTKAEAVHGNTFEYREVIYGQGRGKIRAVCAIHGEFISDIKNHLNGSGCVKCRAVKLAEIAKSNRLTVDSVKEKAAKVHGDSYEYLQVIHVVGKPARIVYRCDMHGEINQSAMAHIRGQGCKRCGVARRVELQKFTEKEVTASGAEIHAGKYLYEGLHTEGGRSYVKFLCPEHGSTIQAVKAHLKGSGCFQCGRKSAGLKYRHDFEEYVGKAEEVHGKDTYRYLSIDYSSRATVVYECSKHGICRQDASKHLQKTGCSRCRAITTKPCAEIVGYLKSLGVSINLEHKFLGSKRLFDIEVESAKLVVEYNGNYWHSSQHIAANQHKAKSLLAEENGYRCIHIRSDEWENKRTAVEYLLKSAAGKVSEKVHARKTQVVKPSKLEASRILDTYHIQGSVAYGEYYGLEEDGQLVAVMVFSRNTSSRREKASDSHVELTRYVTCKQVVGGFTKLLNAFLKANPEVLTVSSYSDVRIFQGGVYEKAGFVKMHTTPPDYMYLEGDTLYHKANYQKSKLAKRFGAEACEGKTERQITEEQGIYRVYDCGKTKWLYARK